MPVDQYDRVLSPKAVAAMTSLSRTTIWRLSRKRGEFPAPIQLSENRIGWSASSVSNWLAERVRASAREVDGNRNG